MRMERPKTWRRKKYTTRRMEMMGREKRSITMTRKAVKTQTTSTTRKRESWTRASVMRWSGGDDVEDAMLAKGKGKRKDSINKEPPRKEKGRKRKYAKRNTKKGNGKGRKRNPYVKEP